MAQLHQARDIYEEALQFTKHHTGRPDMSFCGYVYVGIGRIFRQWNILEKAYRYTTKGVALGRKWNVTEILTLSCVELAYIAQALGYDEESRESIQEASQIMSTFSPFGTRVAAAHQAKLKLAHGNIEAAERWAQTNELAIDGDFEFHREIEYFSLIRVLIAQQRIDEAYALAKRIYEIALETRKKYMELETLILQALICFAKDETDQALVHWVY